MGCDIHLHIEVKIEGEWHHFGRPRISRNYWLFAVIAGVSNYEKVTPIAEPKGLPEDVTRITAEYYKIWEGDAHTASWLGPSEINALRERLKARPAEEWPGTDLEYGILNTYIPENPLCVAAGEDADDSFPAEDLRLVFWFDN